MLGLGLYELVSMLALVGGAVSSLVLLAFRAGKWKKEVNNEHSELKSAHEAVHRDIDYLVEQINGGDTSQLENCPVCSDD